MTLEELHKKCRKQYIHFLRLGMKDWDVTPRNILELLDNSRNRWCKISDLLKEENINN